MVAPYECQPRADSFFLLHNLDREEAAIVDGWNFEYSFDVDLENRLIYEKIYGIWRLETAQAYYEEFKAEVAELIKHPWAKLIDLSSWKTADNQVIEVIGRHLEWAREHNMVWSVNIIDNPVTFAHLMRMFEKGGTKEISKTFRTLAEGEKFLRSEGFDAKSFVDRNW